MARALATGEVSHLEEIDIEAFDGTRKTILSSNAPLRDETGAIAGAMSVVMDITERKRLERALAEQASQMETALQALLAANAAKDEFLGIASHELRTPLASARLNLQVAARRLERALAAGDDPAALLAQLQSLREVLARGEAALDRLARLVADLLDAARIEAGKLELRRDRVDLAALVREVAAEELQAWPGRHVRLAGRLRPSPAADEIVCVEADADRIRQVASNYLSNALKYAPPQRPITIRLTARGRWVRVAVRDEGPGLTPEQQAHVFERFYRAPGIEHQQQAGVGLGLGLYICRTIVERHGGRVGVESAPGQGSTFWFALPLSSSPLA